MHAVHAYAKDVLDMRLHAIPNYSFAQPCTHSGTHILLHTHSYTPTPTHTHTFPG